MHAHVFAIARIKARARMKAFELRMSLVITQHTASVAAQHNMEQADVKVLFAQGDAKFGSMR
jgi:hypothetical protein